MIIMIRTDKNLNKSVKSVISVCY